jgi:nucleoside-diphosphate-sugar epimerase
MPENMLSIYRMFCKEAGLRKPRLLPKSITYPVALIMEICSHAIGAKKPPLLTRARVNMFYDSIGYDTSKALEILGFEAMTPLDVGISKTVKWYRENHYL